VEVHQAGQTQKQLKGGLEVRRFLRANLSAVVATGLEWCLITALVALSVHYLVAATIGAVLGAIADFTIKRRWAFIRGGKTHSIEFEGSRYVLASLASLGWNLLLSYLLVSRMHMPPVPGVIVASLIVGLCWNYPVHRYFVFPQNSAPQIAPAPL
jgi:putative flippase GtrA